LREYLAKRGEGGNIFVLLLPLKKLITILFLLANHYIGAQVNLVPNPSFEEYSQCPNFYGQIDYLSSWYSANNTPDYFNECGITPASVPTNFAGNQFAHSGYGYIGIGTYDGILNTREMIGVKLNQSLVSNKYYCIGLYISLGEAFKYASNNIGVYLSNNTIILTNYQFDIIPNINFQQIVLDSTSWVYIQGYYKAIGGEDYITIGNFFDNNNTELDIIKESSTPFAYYYIDDVSVVECEVPIKIPDVFTPNEDEFNPVFKIENLLPQSNLTIYNRWGSQVYQSNNYQNNWDGENHPSGVYYYILTLATGEVKKGTVTILRD
jgi:gliding motility-associated-like protein